MAEIQWRPYCLRADCTCRIPAILAIAYASFVGSSAPVMRYSSLIGCGASLG